jgi:hypothetical protein
MARRGDSFKMNPISLFALIGGVVAFVAVGAIVDVLWVALGAVIGAGVGFVVRRYGARTADFAEAVDLRESTSKTDLYQQAQELGVEGRSSMSKDELVQAITEKRTA